MDTSTAVYVVVSAFLCVLGTVAIMGMVMHRLTRLLLSREQVMLDRIKAVNQQVAMAAAPRPPVSAARKAGDGNLFTHAEG